MDNQNQLGKIMAESLNSAPQNIRSFVLDGKFDSAMIDIQKESEIDLSQATFLENEILLFVLGLSGTEKLTTEIKKEFGEEKGNKIINLINEKIAEKIRQELLEIYDIEKNNNNHNTDVDMDRNNLLKEIEDPVQPKSPDIKENKNLIGDKLGGTVKLPKENKIVEDKEGRADWKQPIDPYRESFDSL